MPVPDSFENASLLAVVLRQGFSVYLDCPETHPVDQTGFKLKELVPSAFLSAGFKGLYHHHPVECFLIINFQID